MSEIQEGKNNFTASKTNREVSVEKRNETQHHEISRKELESRYVFKPQVQCASPSLNDLRFGF